MREHGLMFSAPMVLAIGADRKHVTRRLEKAWLKVKAGDRIWVREAWSLGGARLVDPVINYRADGAQRPINRHKTDGSLWYPAGSNQPITVEQLLKPSLLRKGWTPGIHMYRWASRYLLEVEEDAREERLQDITEEDAIAEGVTPEALREWLLPSLDRKPAVPMHWIRGSDQGISWCSPCANKEIRRLKKEHPGKEFYLDGGWATEDDSQQFCEGCSRELDNTYTDYAIESELDHFEENGIGGPADEHSMYAILAAPAGPEHHSRIARIGFRWLWDSLHTQPGERWSDNPSLVRIGPFRRL